MALGIGQENDRTSRTGRWTMAENDQCATKTTLAIQGAWWLPWALSTNDLTGATMCSNAINLKSASMSSAEAFEERMSMRSMRPAW